MAGMAKRLLTIGTAALIFVLSLPSITNLKLSALDNWVTIQGYEGLTAGATVPSDSNGVINYSGVSVTVNDNPTYVAGGSKSLKLTPSVSYPWFIIRGKKGDFIGDAFRFNLKFDGTAPQTSEIDAVFNNGTDSTVKLISYKTLSGLVTFKFSDYPSVFTETSIPNLVGFKIVFNCNSIKSPAYIDELQILNPTDSSAPTVTGVQATQAEDGTVTVQWTANDDLTPVNELKSTVYFSNKAITEEMLAELQAGTPNADIQSITVSAGAVSQTVTGLNTKSAHYFAVACEDQGGNIGYGIRESFYRTVRGYEDLAPDSTVASDIKGIINYSGMSVQVNADTNYISGGAQSLKLTPTSGDYPWFGLRAARGDFTGDGIQVYIKFAGGNVPQTSELKAIFSDGKTERSVRLWQYKTVSGWLTVKYSDYPTVFTDDAIADFLGLQLTVNNRSWPGTPMYVDDMQVINPREVVPPPKVIDLDVVKSGDSGIARWTVSTGQPTTTNVYVSQHALSAEILDAYRAGELTDSDIQVIPVPAGETDAAVNGLKQYTQYYFAVAAEDARHYVSYAFSQELFDTIQGYENLQPGQAIDSSSGFISFSPGGSVVVNDDHAFVSGGGKSLKLTLAETDYPWFTLSSLIGSFWGDGFRVYLKFDGDTIPQTSELRAVFSDGSFAKIWQYRTVNGWVTVRYADYADILTEAAVKKMVAIQVVVNNRSRGNTPVYIDDLQIINHREYKDPTEYLTLADFDAYAALPSGISTNSISSSINTDSVYAEQGNSLHLSLTPAVKTYPSLTMKITDDTLYGDGFRYWFKPDVTYQGAAVYFQISQINLRSNINGSYHTFTRSYLGYSAGFAGFVTIIYSSLKDSNGKAPTEEDIRGFDQISFIFNCSAQYDINLYFDKFQVINPVHVPVTGVKLSDSKMEIGIGGSYQMRYNVNPYYALNKRVVWQSDDESVAAVDAKGMVRGIGKGSTIIRVRTVDGDLEASCKVVVRQKDISANRILFDFESGSVPTGTDMTNGTAGIDYESVDEGASLQFLPGTSQASITLKPDKPYQFYGEELSLWVKGKTTSSIRAVMKTQSGETFSCLVGAPFEEGDSVDLEYIKFHNSKTGKAPSQNDIINFLQMTVEVTGSVNSPLYIDSVKIRRPRVYGVITTPQTDNGGLGIRMEDPNKVLGSLAWQAYEILDGIDYDWAWERLEANLTLSSRYDAKLIQINFLNSAFRPQTLTKDVTVHMDIPDDYLGINNLWVLCIDNNGIIQGVRAQHDDSALTFQIKQSGLYVLAAIEGDEFLAVMQQGGSLLPDDDEDTDSGDEQQQESSDTNPTDTTETSAETKETSPTKSSSLVGSEDTSSNAAVYWFVGLGVFIVLGAAAAAFVAIRQRKRTVSQVKEQK